MHKVKRYLWPDYIRVIAIYFVVVMHVLYFPEKLSINAFFTIFIYSIIKICVPLFFILSGFLYSKKIKNYKDFYFSRFKKILLPWLTYSLLGYFLFLLFPVNNVPSGINLFFYSFNLFWFVPLIIIYYLLIPYIKKIINLKLFYILYLYLFIWIMLVSILPYFPLFDIDRIFPRFSYDNIFKTIYSFSGYFILGILFGNKPFLRNQIINILLIILGFSINFSSGLLLSYKFNHLSTYIIEYVSPGIVMLTIGLFGFIYNLESLFNKFKKVNSVILNFSKASYGIYFVHLLLLIFIINRFNLKIITSNIFINTIVLSIFLFIISYFLVSLFTKLKINKKFYI